MRSMILAILRFAKPLRQVELGYVFYLKQIF